METQGTRMKRTIGITGTALIHAALVCVFLYGPPTGRGTAQRAGSSGASEYVNVRLIPKLVSAGIQPVPSTGSQAGLKGKAAEERICRDKDETYQGIGIIYAPLTLVVLEAPESYPAYKAGLREGDVLLEPRKEPDKNGYVIYHVLRDNERLTFQIKQEKICFEQKDLEGTAHGNAHGN
jgi:hypothetical protein